MNKEVLIELSYDGDGKEYCIYYTDHTFEQFNCRGVWKMGEDNNCVMYMTQGDNSNTWEHDFFTKDIINALHELAEKELLR